MLALVVAISIAAALYLRAAIAGSIDASAQIRESRTDAFSVLAGQLDEETGVRGFAATGDPIFLQPYRAGRSTLPAHLASLRRRVAALGIPDGAATVDRASAINREWLGAVAEPIVRERSGSGALQRRGKVLVDAFRATMGSLSDRVDVRYHQVTGDLTSAITRTAFLVAVLIALIVAAIATFSVFQARIARELDDERHRRIAQGEEAAALRAAYETEKHIADTLQDAFSQRPLPVHPALRFSAMYVPATEESKVGGDWYDALELPADRVLFAIGDVAGHGIDAAVGMNRARQALMSAALLDNDPANVLLRVNGDLMRQGTPMVTAVVGFADVRTYEFVYATAGHPPPVLLEPGRAPRMLDLGGLPLGVSRGVTYRTHRVQSVPGSILVLYTDGAVEHSRNVLDGERLLLDAIGSIAPADAADPASAIHRAIFGGRLAGDDVAILTIGFAVAPSSGMRVTADRSHSGFAARIEPSVDDGAARGWRKAS